MSQLMVKARVQILEDKGAMRPPKCTLMSQHVLAAHAGERGDIYFRSEINGVTYDFPSFVLQGKGRSARIVIDIEGPPPAPYETRLDRFNRFVDQEIGRGG